MKLKDKTAIVTGAGRGIGRATALALAREGANVTLAARTGGRDRGGGGGDSGARAAKRWRFRPTWPTRRRCRRWWRRPSDRFGAVDILVNNAGVAGTSPIPEITEELWDRNMAVNLKAVFLCTQAVFSHMCERGRGHILNVSSLAGAPSGSQLRRLRGRQVRACAGSPASPGRRGAATASRATLVEPGPMDTKMRRDNHRDDAARLGQPEDVADLILLAVTQSPQVHIPELPLYTTANPELEMIRHWE